MPSSLSGNAVPSLSFFAALSARATPCLQFMRTGRADRAPSAVLVYEHVCRVFLRAAHLRGDSIAEREDFNCGCDGSSKAAATFTIA